MRYGGSLPFSLRQFLFGPGWPSKIKGPNQKNASYLVRLIWGGEYDKPGFIPCPGDRVVDIGANIGVWSVLAASRGAHVEAYEPHPETFQYLLSNTAGGNITCHEAAVVSASEPQGPATLYLHPTHPTRHSVVGIELIDGASLESSVQVPAVRFTDVIRDGCDLLKLDCEGAEFALLLNAPHDLLMRVRRLIVEIHHLAGDAEALRSHVRNSGFRIEHERVENGPLSLLFASREPAFAGK